MRSLLRVWANLTLNPKPYHSVRERHDRLSISCIVFKRFFIFADWCVEVAPSTRPVVLLRGVSKGIKTSGVTVEESGIDPPKELVLREVGVNDAGVSMKVFMAVVVGARCY